MAEQGSIEFDVDLNVVDAEKKLAELKKQIESVQKTIERQKARRDESAQAADEAKIAADEAKKKVQDIEKEMESIQDIPWSRKKPEDIQRWVELSEQIEGAKKEADELQKQFEQAGEKVDKANAKIEESESKLKQLRLEAEQLAKIIQERGDEDEEDEPKKPEKDDGEEKPKKPEKEEKGDDACKCCKKKKKERDACKCKEPRGEEDKDGEDVEEEMDDAGDAGETAGEKIKAALTGALDAATKSVDKFISRTAQMAKRIFAFSMISKGMKYIRDYMHDVLWANEDVAKALAELKGAAKAAFQPLIQAALPLLTKGLEYLTRLLVEVGRMISEFFGQSYEDAVKSAQAMEETSKASEDMKQNLAGFDTIQTLKSPDEEETAATTDFSGLLEKEMTATEKLFTGLMLVAFGAIVAISGHFLLGIGMIIAGGLLVWKAATEDPDALTNALKGTQAGLVILIAGFVLIALGIIVAICGHLLLGFAMIIAGAYAVYKVAMANEEAISEFLESPKWSSIKAIGGAFMVVIGIICMICGHVLIGLGLVALGAYFLADELIANWGAISEMLRGPIGAVAAIVSAALLVIGIILLFTGAGIPLGLGLIAVGAIGLAATLTANWDWIVEKIKAIGDKIKDVFWKVIDAIKGFFTGCWEFIKSVGDKIKNVFLTVVNAIKGFFSDAWDFIASGIEGFVNLFIGAANWIIGGLNKISFDLPDWVPFGLGGKTFGVNIPEIKEFSLPRFAEGGLIPPNREFLAMLGDNKTEEEIVSPVSAMKQALLDALAEYGGGTGGDIHITVELDGRVVAQNTVKHVNQMNRAAGKSVIVG